MKTGTSPFSNDRHFPTLDDVETFFRINLTNTPCNEKNILKRDTSIKDEIAWLTVNFNKDYFE